MSERNGGLFVLRRFSAQNRPVLEGQGDRIRDFSWKRGLGYLEQDFAVQTGLDDLALAKNGREDEFSLCRFPDGKTVQRAGQLQLL